MGEAFIIDTCRTPRGIGKLGKGALSEIHPQQLASTVLKAIAKRHGRSLQGEVKAILVEAVSFLAKEAQTVSANWKKTLSGRSYGDSADLIREDRSR